jgi:hypothetical protein
LQDIEAGRVTEVVLFEMRGSGDEVDASGVQEMRGCVRPGKGLIWSAGHWRRVCLEGRVDKGELSPVGVAKAALKRRTPRTLARDA